MVCIYIGIIFANKPKFCFSRFLSLVVGGPNKKFEEGKKWLTDDENKDNSEVL